MMAADVFLTGVSSEGEKTYNRLVMRSKLELEYDDENALGAPNGLSIARSDELFRRLHKFVNNITENQARQIIGVLVSAGINITVENQVIVLRDNHILHSLHSNFVPHCTSAQRNNDIVCEKIIYSLLKRAGYDVTDDYRRQSCATNFDCSACRFAINYLYTLWNISRGYVKEVPVGVPVTTTHKCKATRVKHSNMLICECNFKPIYMTTITKFCPYCGGELEINDI